MLENNTFPVYQTQNIFDRRDFFLSNQKLPEINVCSNYSKVNPMVTTNLENHENGKF